MDITNWTVTVGTPTTDENNKVNVTVTYVYNDGTNTYTFTDPFSGVLSNDDLIGLIQTNLAAHDETVQGLLNVPNIVVGQVDSDLVVMTAPDPLETLEVWDPSSQQVVENIGTFDAVATTPSALVWSLGDVVHIDHLGSTGPITVFGPPNDRVPTTSVSPDGSSIAVLWRPVPGSPLATSQAQMAANSSLALVNLSTGTSVTVPGSTGAVGPVAWTADDSRVFFGQRTVGTSSTMISTYAIGASDSLKLKIPRVDIPADFGLTNGSLIVWNSSHPVRP